MLWRALRAFESNTMRNVLKFSNKIFASDERKKTPKINEDKQEIESLSLVKITHGYGFRDTFMINWLIPEKIFAMCYAVLDGVSFYLQPSPK